MSLSAVCETDRLVAGFILSRVAYFLGAGQADSTAGRYSCFERLLQETLYSDLAVFVWLCDHGFDCIALTTIKVNSSCCYQVVSCSQNQFMDDVGLPQQTIT